MDRIAKEYDDKEYKRNQESINANIAAETKFYDDSNRAFDAIQKKKTDSQVKYTKDRVDSLNLELKTELKLHRNSITLMQEDINMKIKQLELLKVFAFGNVESIEIINKAIDNQKAQLKGLGESWDSTAQQIKTTIEGVMTEVITQFATNIGKALAGE
jgi:membrane-associated HD superfamily phosphohydrolase